MILRSAKSTLVVGTTLAALVAGCGGDKEGKPIPAAQAGELQKQLDSIENRFDFGDGACNDIEQNNEPSVRQTLDQLPASVDSDVRNAAAESFDRLFELTSSQCDTEKGRKKTPTKTTTIETTPPPTTTETTPTETTPTQTTPSGKKEKKPKEEKGPKGGGGQEAPPPSSGDGGSGGGDGGSEGG